MASPQDFIPNKAKVEVDTASYQEGVKNFADDQDIVSNVIQAVTENEGRYIGQRDPFISENTGEWNLQDYAFRSGLNDTITQGQKSIGANVPELWERSKVGSTMFYRQVRQKSSNGYAVQTSRDMPFKYQALVAEGVETPEMAEARAEKLNLLAKWSMKMDKFNIKSIEFWNRLIKNGNIPVSVEWFQRKGRRKISVPQFDEDDKITSYEIVEQNGIIVENRPTMTVWPIESVMADLAIGNLQDQECVIASGIVGIGEIVQDMQNGLYRDDLLEDLGRAQQWDGTSGGFQNLDNKKRNRGFDDTPTSSGTGQYLKREVFVNLPIDEETGKWNESENVPVRYRVTMFGNSPGNSVVARVERNQEPDDAIPIEMIHANPDDSDLLYHISDHEVIKHNMSAETTIKRQLIDNNTLTNMPTTIEVRGMVDGNERTLGPNKKFTVENQGDLSFVQIRPLGSENINVLQEIQEDSNRANSIDKNMMGESFGARTSALEANTIAGNSRRPNLVSIEYVLEQYLGWYARRLKVLWEAYGRRDQVIQITDDEDNLVYVKPDEIAGEYDIIIDIMDDMKDSAIEAQKYTNYMQTVGSIPQLSQTADWIGLHKAYAEKILGTSKFVLPNNEGDAYANAVANLQFMLNSGQVPQFDPSMNLRKHLDVYKEERTRMAGKEENAPEYMQALNTSIAMLEQMVQQQGQMAGQAPVATESVAQGQETSGVLGGV